MADRNAEIIRKLIEFLNKKGGKYDVGEWILAELRPPQVFIKGAVGRGLPPEFMEALRITTEKELFEALKSVTVSQRLGESSPFSATFLIP